MPLAGYQTGVAPAGITVRIAPELDAVARRLRASVTYAGQGPHDWALACCGCCTAPNTIAARRSNARNPLFIAHSLVFPGIHRICGSAHAPEGHSVISPLPASA